MHNEIECVNLVIEAITVFQRHGNSHGGIQAAMQCPVCSFFARFFGSMTAILKVAPVHQKELSPFVDKVLKECTALCREAAILDGFKMPDKRGVITTEEIEQMMREVTADGSEDPIRVPATADDCGDCKGGDCRTCLSDEPEDEEDPEKEGN